jgi:DNA-binding winged helix-turn-helix (wHTH) protein/tetratricopeptide (TPR) repeat protein
MTSTTSSGPESSEPSRLLFDDFELRLDGGELFKGGAPVKLQPQPARVLAILANRAGQVVEREEIRQLVWGDSFLDFDASLNFSIKQIRQALGDSATEPRFVETLPRRGYRFLMPVRPGPMPVPTPEPVPPPRPAPRRGMSLALLSMTLLAGALLVLLGNRHAHVAHVNREIRRPLPAAGPPRQPVKPSAYEAYLRGVYLRGQHKPREAAASLQDAVLLDPSFASAYAALAMAKNDVELPLWPDMEAIDVAARRALKLDPNLAQARLALAENLFHAHLDWEHAGREFRRALALNPGDSETHRGYAFYLASLGWHDEAIAAISRARELDPASKLMSSDLVFFLYMGRRYDEAVRQASKTLELISSSQAPSSEQFYSRWALRVLYRCAFEMGNEAAAVKAGKDLMEIYGEGRKAAQVRTLRDFLKWEEPWAKADRPYFFAVASTESGHYGQALDALEEDCRTRKSFLLHFVAVEPAFVPLHGDPRFARILDCIKLPADAPARRAMRTQLSRRRAAAPTTPGRDSAASTSGGTCEPSQPCPRG